MIDPNIRPSDDVVAQALEEALLIDVDWRAQYLDRVAGLQVVSKALEVVTDPGEVLALTELKAGRLVQIYGSLALWGNKVSTLKDHQAFEAEFGYTL